MKSLEIGNGPAFVCHDMVRGAVVVLIAAGGLLLVVESARTPHAMPSPTSLGPDTTTARGRTNAKDGLEYMSIPAGTFQMGCVPLDAECGLAEKPRHEVTLSHGFWLGKTEVTVGAYRRFTSATGYRTAAEREGWAVAWNGTHWAKTDGASWRDPGFPQGDESPVVDVSWDDAKAFCEWSGGRLPTETEWEYAARAGGETIFIWGDEQIPLRRGRTQANLADETAKRKFAGWTILAGYDDGHAVTAPVARLGANGFGLHDMAGNVWEWCADLYDDGFYARSPGTDPRNDSMPPDTGMSGHLGSSGSARVTRGGSWMDYLWKARVSYRGQDDPSKWGDHIGLRCARDVAP